MMWKGKWKEEKWKKRNKIKRKKKVKYRKVKWWKKCKELIISLSLMGMMRGQKKKEGRKGERCPEARPAFGKVWKVALSLSDCGTELAKRERGSRRTTEKDGGGERMQQEVQVKESRWAEEIPQRLKQPKGEDRTEMKKEARRLRCTLLNGSAWSTDKNT